MAKEAKKRKKLPKAIAIINADNCTGCESCIEVCPVDCISKVPGDSISVLQGWCEIDVEKCVGCEVCVKFPSKKTDPFTMFLCPWDAIEMIKPIDLGQHVAAKGGPDEYLDKHWERVVEPAIAISELAYEQAVAK